MALLRQLARPSIPSLKPVLANFTTHRPFNAATAAHIQSKVQVYISHTNDPLLNLSFEHRLLQTSHPDSTILLLYTNSPCVIFGRNQNPWLEVHLNQLKDVQLVRRRSGGGTVFHDEGNVNFSVICPPAVFDRDRHAEMVVRALGTLGKKNTRVNERHDIVMDVPEGTFKISGSAYKLTRQRSLHHGTCLLCSPNLSRISPLLRSSAEPFVKARGVDSVRSPVANVGVDPGAFIDAVVAEFGIMYGEADVKHEFAKSGKETIEVEGIRDGMEELASRDWIYGQTPKFTFSTYPTEDDLRERPALPFGSKVYFEARRGIIENFSINGAKTDSSALIGANLCDIDDWNSRLSQAGIQAEDSDRLGAWMDGVLGTHFTKIKK